MGPDGQLDLVEHVGLEGLFYTFQVILNFIGCQEESTPSFHIQSPLTSTISSNSRRRSLSECGVVSPCTFSVIWDGQEQSTSDNTVKIRV